MTLTIGSCEINSLSVNELINQVIMQLYLYKLSGSLILNKTNLLSVPCVLWVKKYICRVTGNSSCQLNPDVVE